MGGISGQATEIEIHAKEIIRLKRRLQEILAKHTGREFQEIERDTDRDYFMSADEARDYGIIDHVVAHKKETLEIESEGKPWDIRTHVDRGLWNIEVTEVIRAINLRL